MFERLGVRNRSTARWTAIAILDASAGPATATAVPRDGCATTIRGASWRPGRARRNDLVGASPGRAFVHGGGRAWTVTWRPRRRVRPGPPRGARPVPNGTQGDRKSDDRSITVALKGQVVG